ncbi:biopolymer transport protein ExbD [Cetobacterium ceti]|uniref:Biopolymer transport protein ExbD n=1 Tax=Cetobacterium ceti TaxID=180163 RepID=A0A1T4NCT3_9FUSO|nr:biopolymer transporter ExbD [Cetobacterium ceti]SJZ77101.1 biopolymer transport protein ExbD [Cetobacterium ceti]
MRRKAKRDLITPDLTPLIDVVFLLLIFFMIVTNFNKYSGFKLELPTSGVTTEIDQNKALEIIIDKDKRYFVKNENDSKEIPIENLAEYITGQKEVIVTADKSLDYETVVELLGKIKNNSVESISLSTFQ